MVALTWIVLTILILGTLAFIFGPVWRTRARASNGRDLPSSAEKEKELLLIRDLDFDRATGKLDEEEYQAQRSEAERRALEEMKRIDATAPGPRPVAQDIESTILRERERLRREVQSR